MSQVEAPGGSKPQSRKVGLFDPDHMPPLARGEPLNGRTVIYSSIIAKRGFLLREEKEGLLEGTMVLVDASFDFTINATITERTEARALIKRSLNAFRRGKARAAQLQLQVQITVQVEPTPGPALLPLPAAPEPAKAPPPAPSRVGPQPSRAAYTAALRAARSPEQIAADRERDAERKRAARAKAAQAREGEAGGDGA